jgi:SAM-dependent methyltransferase
MELAYDTAEANPLVAAICSEEVLASTNMNIHAADEMLVFLEENFGGDRDPALAVYFQSGQLIWETFREILLWHFGSLDRIGRLLDFASGYGRVTRFIVRDLPPERVWVSDIYEEGVRFQEAQFGVHGLVSTAAPEDLSTPERFDCILVSSLFSHLPEETFHGWLSRLHGLLNPGGLLVFSVHGWNLLHPPREETPEGFLFAPLSESVSLEKNQYGTCWVTEAFVRRAALGVDSDSSVHRIPRGFCNFQDLYVLVDRPEVDFSPLQVRPLPEGYIDSCKLTPPDRIDISGWVADRGTAKPIREVRLLVDGQVLQVCRLFHPRGDVAELLFKNDPGFEPQGWHFAIRLPRGTSRSTGALAIRVIDTNGLESTLYAATIDAALLASLQRDVVAMDTEIHRIRKHHGEAVAQRKAETDYEISVLKARIAAMENSRFWKIRNGWFGIKRRLGLTRDE